MLSKLEQAKKEWGHSLVAIDKWLKNRQELIVLYYKVAGISPSKIGTKSFPEQKQISKFCQIMLDYTSTGHFEVYEKIIEKSKLKGTGNFENVQKIYSTINKTTDQALKFNDKYGTSINEKDLLSFDKDLSELGQIMEKRFEREDLLLKTMHDQNISA